MMGENAAQILAEWRAVERELDDPELGPTTREILEAKAASLQARYQELVAELRPGLSEAS